MSADRSHILDVTTGTPGDAVAAAVVALAAGELVVLPTETVYGLACRADSEDAVGALPVLVADRKGLGRVCAEVTPELARLAAAFWPGPLTIVVARSAAICDLATGGLPTVGVRVPDSDVTRAVLLACAFPVAVTSANLSGEPPAVAVNELPAELLDRAAVVLDAGACPGATPSTVLDLAGDEPRILRAGPVSAGELGEVLGRAVADA
jgi:L-threonylcarbamoyladenylate synthase